MATAQNLERNGATADIKAICRWIQKKLGVSQPETLIVPIYNDINEYSPRYIARRLAEKDTKLRVFFHFKDMNDYITLSSNGQLNVRDGQEELFKAWGISQFRDLNPQTIFQELEGRIRKINVVSFSDYMNHSFNSYSDFIEWL
jgi:hypothetical protein